MHARMHHEGFVTLQNFIDGGLQTQRWMLMDHSEFGPGTAGPEEISLAVGNTLPPGPRRLGPLGR